MIGLNKPQGHLLYIHIVPNLVICRSPLGSNMYTYLKFGLPRVFPPNGGGPRGPRDGSSGYDSSEDGGTTSRNDKRSQAYYLRTQSNPDFRNIPYQGVSKMQ